MPCRCHHQGHLPGSALSPLLWLRQWCSIRAALAIILWGSSKDMRPDMRNGALGLA